MTKVKGIGGVFIDSNHAEQLANWYMEILGVDMEEHPNGGSYYCVFQTRDYYTSQVRENPVFAINQVDEPLSKDQRGFTLNLRVDNMEAFLAMLESKGVQKEGKLLVWERGKHAQIRDLDGNRIELYEEVTPTLTD